MLLKKQRLSLCFFALLATSLSGLALNTDQNQKLYIVSQTADMNRTTGIGIFKGDVVIDQGTTHVTGDQVVTHNDKNNKLEEVVITGINNNLASYKTLTETGKPPLVATAGTIKYYPQQHYVILLKSASIKQGANSINGEHLEYDIAKQLLNSTATALTGGGPSRTTIVIQPDGNTSISSTPGS